MTFTKEWLPAGSFSKRAIASDSRETHNLNPDNNRDMMGSPMCCRYKLLCNGILSIDSHNTPIPCKYLTLDNTLHFASTNKQHNSWQLYCLGNSRWQQHLKILQQTGIECLLRRATKPCKRDCTNTLRSSLQNKITFTERTRFGVSWVVISYIERWNL